MKELAPLGAGYPELDRVLDHYRHVFAGDEATRGTILEMEVGSSGYCAYWAVEIDTKHRYWLGPLFKVEPEPFDSAILVRREEDGFKVDFGSRLVKGRDRFYDSIVSADMIDSLEPGRFYGLPIAEVEYSFPNQRPGFYCDESGQPPSPGPNGELYTAFD